jgi:hypothetical protein
MLLPFPLLPFPGRALDAPPRSAALDRCRRRTSVRTTLPYPIIGSGTEVGMQVSYDRFENLVTAT